MKDSLRGNRLSHRLISEQLPSKSGELHTAKSMPLPPLLFPSSFLPPFTARWQLPLPPLSWGSLFFKPNLSFPSLIKNSQIGERVRATGGRWLPRSSRGMTGVKEQPVEKKTKVFTVAPLQSQTCGGVGLEGKQPLPLSNQTLGARIHSENTQNGAELWRQHLQGAPPRSGSSSHLADQSDVHTESSGSEPSPFARDEGAAPPPSHEVCLSVFSQIDVHIYGNGNLWVMEADPKSSA